MVYRRFGPVYSRLLLSKQDEMSRMEAMLLAWDKTDEAERNECYLMSRSEDVARDKIPEVWEGQSRVMLLEKMEKLALGYGEFLHSLIWTHLPRPIVFQGRLRYCHSTTITIQALQIQRWNRGRDSSLCCVAGSPRALQSIPSSP